MPEVQDIKHTGPVLKHKQSKTEILPRLSSRICVAGPSGVGKGVLVMLCNFQLSIQKISQKAFVEFREKAFLRLPQLLFTVSFETQ